MMSTIGINLYIMAVGFVTAGIIASFVQLVSGKPARFELAPETLLGSIGGVMLGLTAGPAILMRNAWRGMWIEARPPFWFLLSLMIAGVWSLFSGAIVLGIAFSV
ncbi:MAG: DUF6949 family protein [Methyloligella sp. ZOD6]